MARAFMIGDIHGCCKTFRKMVLEEIGIRKTDNIYCLGDYIDRGPDSKGVIDFIFELRKKGYKIHTLRGNHEQLLLDSMLDNYSNEVWMRNGGINTLMSFDGVMASQLDPVYIQFFESTLHYIQTKDFILVHAGLNFDAPNPLEDFESMLWMRKFTIDPNFLGNRILIHGHTPEDCDFILSQKFASPINLDGGCVYNWLEGYGSLFALNFYEKKFLEVPNIDEPQL